MPTAQPISLYEADRALAALARDWFENDLRERVDGSIERQLAVFLAAKSSPFDLARAV